MFSIQIKIWHKLFFSIVLVVTLVLIMNMEFNRLSFEQGFNQYIEEVRLKKLERLKESLNQLYQQDGSWNVLIKDFKLWHRLLADADLAPPLRPDRIRPSHPGMNNPPRPLPPHLRHGSHAPTNAHRRSAAFFPVQIGLFDKNQQHIIGPRLSSDNPPQPIMLNQQIIGYLTIPSTAPLRSTLDKRFAQRQVKHLLLTALASLIIAIIASLLLANVFNRPISGLANMARELTSGNFEKRIKIKSRDELAGLAQDLNHLAETLYHNQQSRRQWIADISHELRTPLTVLRGELEAMEDGIRAMDKASINSLSLEIQQLSRLVDDLYQLSTADQGALSYHKTPLNIIALLTQLIDSMEHRFQQKNLSVSFTKPDQQAIIFADPQRMMQLFTNVLENSLRYTHAGGQIAIHCQVQGATLSIIIEDSSPGVPAALIPRLFERLFRVEHSRNRDTGGSGLGLSIVKSIAQAHHIQLSAAPSSWGGLKITLTAEITKNV